MAIDRLETVCATIAAYGTAVALTSSSTYDLAGRMQSTTDPNTRTTAYTYDVLGRTKAVNFADDTFAWSTYDISSRLVSATDEEGRITSYGYDAASRRARVTFTDGTATTYVYCPPREMLRTK